MSDFATPDHSLWARRNVFWDVFGAIFVLYAAWLMELQPNDFDENSVV